MDRVYINAKETPFPNGKRRKLPRPSTMFEKSLYDLIRGLRNHKGNEKEYIQKSLKECRVEVQGKDMDVKATALMKLIYLEMFGHDMSWASFYVLEVMSSAKYLQKRVGYLGAVQSFRPDTEVLMLATNLLKKDIVSVSSTTMSLPIITLPHIITPSLAMSVLGDLLPRLTHSSPTIRKKTIVTVYRLALVYPETLRPAWPKIKERLMDEKEDSSVTAAIVNVVCELGWRRPQDFLPLAPRLFELLVDSGNNWMAIKLIKLFATLTPLEPRLVRKLLPPLTSIIQTTPAMSLLYECINGIIQGGILDSSDDSQEIATLCVTKLRGMIMVEGDANLKYVALLAFNRIVRTHPYLVAQQEDVIMDCLESADISIRLRALDLVVGMVSVDNLVSIVGRLMRQLRNSPTGLEGPADVLQSYSRASTEGVVPKADSDDESPEVTIKSLEMGADFTPVLPDDYKTDVIRRILEICSASNYANLSDFEWYIDVLLQLVRNSPVPSIGRDEAFDSRETMNLDVSEKVGDEIRNVAVKVTAVRASATRAAESIIIASYNGTFSRVGAGKGALRSVVWVAGEYATYLSGPEDVLIALLQMSKSLLSAQTLATYLQSIPKVFSLLAADEQYLWTSERKTMISLLIARVVHALEPLAMHPDLEVQERAVEFSELLRLAAEASATQDPSSDDIEQDAPLLLTQAIPSIFSGYELNSVAPSAQRNVPIPSNLDLEQPINLRLSELLIAADSSDPNGMDQDDFEVYYHQSLPATTASSSEPAVNRLAVTKEDIVQSYQQGSDESYLDPDIMARRRAERNERHKDDPFYIAGSNVPSGASTPLHNIIHDNNGTHLDIDSIPIMQLNLGKTASTTPDMKPRPQTNVRQRIQVAADETLVTSGASTPRNEDSENSLEGPARIRHTKGKQSFLLVDSSNIGAFSLEGDGSSNTTPLDYERQQREEVEMAKAMQEVEKLRLEMQRANERIQAAQDVPPDGTIVKKKTKKKSKPPVLGGEDASKRKKKKKVMLQEESAAVSGGEATTARKELAKMKTVIGGGDDGGTEPAGVAGEQ